jgi:hypothetical protein
MRGIATSRRVTATLAGVVSLLVAPALPPAAAGALMAPTQERTAPVPRPADAPALAEFKTRVDAYVELQNELASKLTRLSKEATPEDIDTHERALAALIENARRTAKPGDLFTPAVQTIVRRELGRIFAGPEGRQLISSIMDENPAKVTLRVNARYPDEVPMSTMPPEVLAVLPPLPGDLNYRFITNQLLLLDTEAHIVVDYVSKALP